MPMYEYVCTFCKSGFEARKKMSDPEPDCIYCGHKEVQQILSAPQLRFTGSGFYITDYPKGAKPSEPR
jgi:putative FmdB family regulatory protein